MGLSTLSRLARTVTVSVLATTEGIYGEQVEAWTVTATLQGRAQPMTLEDAGKAGLIGTRERVRVYLPAGTILTPAERLAYGGRTYAVVSVNAWPGHTEAIGESV